MSDEERVYRVEVVARVEGEGRFEVRLRDGEVVHARLSIFEAPRFFEAFLRGRSIFEVPDIVARICGICPVAYQMSGARAIERALGVEPGERIRILRRILYCGEWIESHALHVFLLHAPDFLGYASAVEMAAQHRGLVEDGLAIKKAGNAIVALLGGRAIHPVSACIGGFTRAPATAELRTLIPMLDDALERASRAVRWAASLPCPPVSSPPYVFVALDSDEYPLEQGGGVLVSPSGGGPVERVPFDDWDEAFVETQVPHSNALQCHLKDGTPYLCGPMARLHHHFEKLHPTAGALAREVGLPATLDNPHRSIVVRAIEIVHALAEAIDRIAAYARPEPAASEVKLFASEGAAATEAPRGLLWHRYRFDAEGQIEDARIVAPTSQNQARIEADLIGMAGELVRMDHEAATRLCEALIRAYDPCISCATHFLCLSIEDEGPS